MTILVSIFCLLSFLQLGMDPVSADTDLQESVYALTSNFVSATSKLYTTGGDLYLYGDFGNVINQINATVNNINCPIQSYSNDTIHCQIPGGFKSGLADLTVFSNNNKFFSSSILFIYDSTQANQCRNGDQTVDCNGNGQCVNNKCVCSSGFGGYYCESELVSDIIINPEPSAPSFIFNTTNTGLSFNIISIQELDELHNLKDEYKLTNTEWDTINTESNDIINNKYQLPTSSNAAFDLEINIDHFKSTKDISFGGIVQTYQPNTLKVSVTITGWQFKSNLNTLRLLVATEMNSESVGCPSSTPEQVISLDAFDNLQYLKFIQNGVAYYGRFLDYMLSDSRPAYSLNEVVSSTKTDTVQSIVIGLNMPQAHQSILDPDFSALVDSNSTPKACNDIGSSKLKAFAPLIVIGVSVIAGLLTYLILRIRHRRKKQRMQQKHITLQPQS